MKTIIVTGHYGSGKTEFCVNLALEMSRKADGSNVYIADMDIINPYFRSREKAESLSRHGIEIVGNELGNSTGQDIPAVSYGFLSLVSQGECVIMDLAGNEAGLRVLAPCYGRIRDYELLCVLNLFRPETDSAEKMVDFIKSVNASSGFAVTGVVNNGHLLRETTAQHILMSQESVLRACGELRLPLRYTLIKSDIYEQIKTEIKSEKSVVFDELQMREIWQ